MEFTLTKEQLAIAELPAKGDQTRWRLHTLNVTPKYAQVSDGHMLVRIPHAGNDGTPRPSTVYNFPPDKAVEIAKDLKKTKWDFATFQNGNGNQVSHTKDGTTVTFESDPNQFPDGDTVESLIPKADPHYTVCLSLDLLEKFVKTMRAATGSQKKLGIKFHFQESNRDAIRFETGESLSPDRLPVSGLLMPMTIK